MNNLKNYETDESINKVKGIINLYDLIFEDGKMGIYHGDLIKYYLYLSRLQYEKSYDEDAFESLDNALYHAKKLVSLPVGKHYYSSILVKGVQYEIKERINVAELLLSDWPWWNLPDCNDLKNRIENDPKWIE